MPLAKFLQISRIRRGVTCAVIITAAAAVTSCSEKKESGVASEGAGDYYHPSVSTAPSATTSAPKLVKKDLSLTDDVVLELGTAKVTIPAGAVLEEGTATLQSFSGTFVNSSSLRLVSESLVLALTKADNNEFSVDEIYRDIVIQQQSVSKTSSAKLIAVFDENATLKTATKTGLTKKRLSGFLSDEGEGVYVMTLGVRLSRVGFALAESTGGALPTGFSSFVLPPKDPTDLTATATTPSDVTVTWKGDSTYNSDYAIVYWADGEAEPLCTGGDEINATEVSSGNFSYAVTGLLDETYYTIKVCGLSSRSPADASEGAFVPVTTPARAQAALSNTPSDPSKSTVLDVTVGGTDIVEYKYALLTNAASCDGATFSASWIPIATRITDALPQVTDDVVRLCVLGKIDDTNVQLVATEVSWTVDKTAPVFASQVLVAPALDGYLNSADRALTGGILGALTATGHVVASTAYKTVSSATTCDESLTYSTTAPQANTADITVDGNYKVCVRLVDAAYNYTYGDATTFSVDTSIGFTAAALTNEVANSYLNAAEAVVANALVTAATGTSFDTARYVVAPWATACTVALTYSAVIPANNDAGFTGDGDFKVCVQLSDSAGNTAYGNSTVIHRKVAQPAFTSMALANTVADSYLSIADHLLTSALAGTVVGSNYDTAEYAVALDAAACSAVGTWSASIPQADDAGVSADGSLYKVCAKLTDNAGNTTAYGATGSFTYDATLPNFTSAPLANGASDNFLNSAEITAAANVHGAAVGSGFTAEAYAIATAASSCDGALTYGATIKKSDDAALVSGATYKVCVRVADAAENYAYGATDNITVIAASPDCTGISLANDATDLWINSSERLLTNAVAGAASTNLASPVKTYAIIAAAGACDGTVTFGAQDAVPASDDAGLADATSYKICAKVTDAALNTPAYCSSATFAVDTTVPVFTSMPLRNTALDGVVNIEDHALTTDVAGPLTASGQTAESYSLVTSATACSGATYVAGVPTADHASLSSSGTYKVCVKLIDTAGNITYDSTSTFTSDQVAPSFTSLALANEAAGGYINLSEAASVLAAADTLVAGGQTSTTYGSQTSAGACSAAVYAGSSPTVADVAALGDGSFKICVKLEDASGNITYGPTSTIVVDKTVPAFTSLTLANDAANTYINAAERVNTTAMASAVTGSGYDTVTYTLVADPTVCSGAAGWASSIPKSDSGSFGSDGDYIICAKLTDYAGNPDAFGSSATIHLNTDLPVFTSIALANDVSDSLMNANEHTLGSSLVDTLVGSDYVSVAYVVTPDATACTPSLTYGAPPIASDAAINGAGDFKVCVQLTDVAGNKNYGASSAFEYDPTAPTFTSLALAGDVTDNWLNASEHALTNDLGGSLTAANYTAATYAVVTVGTTCNSGVTYGAMPKSDDAAITDSGTWKLCVKLSDAAGNNTYGTGTGTFESDYGVPAFTSVALTGTSADTFINASDASGSTNIVNAAAGSNHSTAAYALATSATTCDVSLTYGSIPKTDDAGFTADGTYKVCVKLTDTAGNTPAYGFSGTFTRDVTLPSSAVTTSGTLTPNSTAGATTQIAGTASDAAAGVSSVTVSIQEGSGSCYSASTNTFASVCPNWIAATGTTSWTYDLPDDALMDGVTYNLEVRATDAAVSGGNVQTSYGSGSFIFNAAEGVDLWNEAIVYDNGGDDRPTAAAMDSTGNLFVVGWHTVIDKNWMIKKFDKRGNEDTTAWNKDVGDTGSVEVANGVAVDSSNNVYVVGSRHNGSNLDWWLKKYDSTGAEDTINWDIILDGNSSNDEAMAVAVDTSSNLYVVGYGTNIASGSSGEDIWIRKYSAAGILGCEQKIDGAAASLADRALSVAVNSGTGKLYISGFQTVAGPDQQMFVRRMRTSDCTIEATATTNTAGTNDQGVVVRLDSAGNVYVGGRDSGTDSDWMLRKYSSALAFQSDFGDVVASSHEALAMVIDASNNIYVGGYKTAATQNWWLRQVSTGLVEDTANWNLTLDAAGGADQITSLMIGTGTNDVGSVYAIGWGTNIAGGSTGADWWIRKYAGP